MISAPSQNEHQGGRRTELLVPLLYATFYMANGVIQPFLPIYYASLGYKGEIIGLIGSITPFTTFIVGPLWGLISDRLQSPFAILYITICVSLIVQLLVGLVDNPYYVMALVGIKSVFGAPIRSLIDSLVLQQMADRSQYGKMRLWSVLGTGVGTSVAGYFIKDFEISSAIFGASTTCVDLLKQFYESLSGYRLLFFAHAALHIPVFIALRCFQVDHDHNTHKTTATATAKNTESRLSLYQVAASVFANRDALVFFTTVYAMGISGGVADNFTYVRFKEVGATSSNMGFSRLLSSLAGAIMFWYSKALGSFLGTKNVLSLSLLAVAIRFALYVMMDQPLHGYIAEILRGLTFGCFWSTATVYANEMAPDDAGATMLLFLNGLYNGIGRSTGAIVGGKLQATIGTADTFFYGFLLYLFLAVVYAMYNFKFPEKQEAKLKMR